MKTFKIPTTVALLLTGIVWNTPSLARDQIQIVGSSTVFPFATAVAETYGRKGGRTPVVESTGSGGGMKLFCSGVGEATPDITNTSRRIKSKEFQKCQENGVTPVEVKIGFDGIVLANSKAIAPFELTLKQIYLALAKEVPDNGKMVANPNMMWSDISPELPAQQIEVLGPPPTSGTRDAFAELVMQGGAKKIDHMRALHQSDEEVFKKIAAEIREDGVYIEAGENDNLIVQKLEANPNALGIFGFSFLDLNSDKVQGAVIGDIEPTFDNIASGDYPVSRSLFFYIKKEHVGVIPGIKEFIAEFISENSWGDEGYLTDKGLIPLPRSDRDTIGKSAKNLTPLTL